MEKYDVTGMSCAACVARVEKAVSKVEGVSSCAVSLLTNSMQVEGTASSDSIIKAVVDAGYGAAVKGGASALKKDKASHKEDELKDTETPRLLKRLGVSLGFLLVLMYFGMGHMMWDWPLPPFFEGNLVAVALVEMILSSIIMLINKKFFVSGFKSVIHGSPNMDTLVAMGSGISYIWSIYMLFVMTSLQVKGDEEALMQAMDKVYFESAAMILVLITVGKTLEAFSKGKTTSALKSLMKLSPDTVTLLRDGREVTVGIGEAVVGDVFTVRPGENIPLDGVVIEGNSAVNESALTGESLPVDKEKGSTVSSGTLNQSGFLKCRAVHVGEDTAINRIIQMVSDASTSKAPIAKIADKVSGVFVPSVISVAVITFIVWLLISHDLSYSLERGVSVLVISCPCALGLATPVAIMVGNGKGARNGILFKTAESLEETGKVSVIALDKTGTITKGEPSVTDIIPSDGVSNEYLLQAALDLEAKSEHPLSRAVISEGQKRGLVSHDVEGFKAVGGKGLSAVRNGVELKGGSSSFTGCTGSESLAQEGKTLLYFTEGEKELGVIAVADVIKEDSAAAIKKLQAMGIKVVMLTGDNEVTARSIAAKAGVDEVIAGVLPEGKAEAIKKLKADGAKVCMVGDGINDAPALTVADTGIAIGAGTDVAIDAADVVLVKGSLMDAASAVALSRRTLLNIKENLFWAFIYNVIGIPLAAGCYAKLFGWSLTPMFGAAAMSLSSFCVVSNALRLNFVRLFKRNYIEENDKETNTLTKECNDMTKTLKVEGMMCSHCEAHVKEALEKLDGVVSAKADHEKAIVMVELSKDVAEDAFKAAVTGAGYEFKGLE